MNKLVNILAWHGITLAEEGKYDEAIVAFLNALCCRDLSYDDSAVISAFVHDLRRRLTPVVTDWWQP